MRGTIIRRFAIATVVALSALAFSGVAHAGKSPAGSPTLTKSSHGQLIGHAVPAGVTGEQPSGKSTGQYYKWSLFFFWLRGFID